MSFSDDELARMRIRHIRDQADAQFDEAASLVEQEGRVSMWGPEVSDTSAFTTKEARALLSRYHDMPMSDWMLDELFPEEADKPLEQRRYTNLPYLMNWHDTEDGPVVRTTLSVPLMLFLMGWRSAMEHVEHRTGNREPTIAHLSRITTTLTWILTHAEENKLDPALVPGLAKMRDAAVKMLEAFEYIPADWWTEDDD